MDVGVLGSFKALIRNQWTSKMVESFNSRDMDANYQLLVNIVIEVDFILIILDHMLISVRFGLNIHLSQSERPLGVLVCLMMD